MAKERLFSDALRVAALMKERKSGKTRLRLIAERLVHEAELGNVAAMKEVADRLEGKVPQALIGDSDADPINMVTEIRRTIVRPAGS
jgi:hypothetical protein